MGTLKGFAPPFGPPLATSSPLALLGLANPSRDGPRRAELAGSPRDMVRKIRTCPSAGNLAETRSCGFPAIFIALDSRNRLESLANAGFRGVAG
jgi:hypothetical protein